MISKHFDKEKPHHAYLIEGERDEIIGEILKFVESFGVSVVGNPDFCHITLDSFKIEDARNLKSLGSNKSFSTGKKVFVVSANSFLLEAQNTLLKIFEEPIENTHFFLITPDVNALLPTFISRFYVISSKNGSDQGLKSAENFITIPLAQRIDFIKELLTEREEDEEANPTESSRAKALNFLNSLESVLHKKFLLSKVKSINIFEQIFKVRKFLRMPGSSAKSLMESVALAIPNI